MRMEDRWEGGVFQRVTRARGGCGPPKSCLSREYNGHRANLRSQCWGRTGVSVSRLASLLNNNWIAGIGGGFVVWAITSGLVPELDRTTFSLTALAGLLAFLSIWVTMDNKKLRDRVAGLEERPRFDPQTGFCFMPTDCEQEYPLCPDCASKGRPMKLVRDSSVWHCSLADCTFYQRLDPTAPSVSWEETY